jgi:hypothetical protein
MIKKRKKRGEGEEREREREGEGEGEGERGGGEKRQTTERQEMQQWYTYPGIRNIVAPASGSVIPL